MEKQNGGVLMETSDFPLTVYAKTCHEIYQSENSSDVMALYISYCAISFWKKETVSAKSMCSMLKMSKVRFMKARKELERLGLIDLSIKGEIFINLISPQNEK